MAEKLQFQYHDGGRAAAGYPDNRAKDCAVRAVSIVTGAPYDRVWRAAYRFNAEQGKPNPDRGTSPDIIQRLLRQFAREVQIVHPFETIKKSDEWYIATTQRLIAESLPPKARCLVLVRGHALAVIEGVVYDVWNPAKHGRRRIEYYYRVTPREEYLI